MYRIALILAVLAAASVPARAEMACASNPMRVNADDAEIAARVCRLADTESARFAECGLKGVPPFTINIVAEMPPSAGQCIGVTDCNQGIITVLEPGAMSDADILGIYEGIGPLAVFDSLVRHELAHAALSVTLAGRSIGVAAHEYVAYALQIDALDPEDRAVFLKRQNTVTPESAEELNAFILMAAPGVFAAKAWLHFAERENGCGFVRLLIDGTRVLGVPSL